MTATLWYLTIGALLICMALASSMVKRLPLSTATLYLFIGIALGPGGAGLLHLDPLKNSAILERITEVAVIISLFSAGLKLRVPLRDRRWRVPFRLAVVSMILTVGLVTLVGVFALGLPLGAAVLLGGILAPTDPVLASDVQVEAPGDVDRLRFGLTGEAGLNDGTAFPFVMLGLGLLGIHDLGIHDLGAYISRWFFIDVVWSVTVGIGTGWLLGTVVGHLVLYLRRVHKEAVGLDEFIGLGLLALSYGTALLLHSYGFLAVFFSGLALRRIEHQSSGGKPPEAVILAANAEEIQETATNTEKAPAYMAGAVLAFNEQLERITEVGVVLLIGGMVSLGYLSREAIIVVPLLFLVIRPLSVRLGLIGADTSLIRQNLIAWFGIRGIGSFYYLMYAIQLGLPTELASRLISLVVTVVAVSIVVHGVSATPLMGLYGRLNARRRPSP
ncbi:MAG: cation:proton antiporter [Pseudomonadota bacterium]